MHIEILLTPHIWLQASPEVRLRLAKAFGLKRSTSPRCIVERGVTRIESDGYTVEDLRLMNRYTMHKFLGRPMIDLDADLHKLFIACVEMLEREVEDEKPKDDTPSVKAPFCDSCDSKGVKHKKTCPKK